MTPQTLDSISPRVLEGTMTYEDFLDWADEDTHAEWVDGKVVFMTADSYEHNTLAGLLYAALSTFVEERGYGVVMQEPFQMKGGPELPGRSPDVFFVANEHRHRISRKCLYGPADLVMEVQSDSTRGVDHGDKFLEYQAAGVREYWMIDQEKKCVECYRLDDRRMFQPVQPDEAGIVRSTVLPEVWIRPEWFWQDRLPTRLGLLHEWGI